MVQKFTTYVYNMKTFLCLLLPLLLHGYIVNLRPNYSSKSQLFSSPVSPSDISNYKAKELKQILQASNINTKSLYDKKELEDALLKELIKWNDTYESSITNIPLHIIQYGTLPKDYTAIDVTMNNSKLKFIIDTGSSINIIKTDVFKNLHMDNDNFNSNLPNATPIYTQGVGGGGAVSGGSQSSSSSGGNTLKVIPLQLGNAKYTLPFILLDNMQFFPANVAGILGIDFLENICGQNQVINLNYEKLLFEYGPIGAFLSPLKKWNTKKIKMTRISPNLLTCDTFITSQKAQNTIRCVGLIDLGSAATIINIPTVKALREDPLQLDVSPLSCVGVDNRPMRMKTLRLSQYTIGELSIPSMITSSSSSKSHDHDNKSISTPSSSTSTTVTNDSNDNQQLSIQVLVADIPALKTIGLSDQPAMILGQDLLQQAHWSSSSSSSSALQSSPSSSSQQQQLSQQQEQLKKKEEKKGCSGQIILDLVNNHLYIPQ